MAGLWRNSAVRYLIAGVVAFAINVALLNVFREFLGWPTGLSALVAFWCTFGANYTIQRVFAFSSRASVPGSLVKYSLLVAFNSVVVAVIVAVAHDSFGLGLGTSQLIATAMTTLWNYIAYKHWVYAVRGTTVDHET